MALGTSPVQTVATAGTALANSQNVSTGSNVTAGNLLIVITHAFKYSLAASNDLISTVARGATSFTLAKRQQYKGTGGSNHTHETCIWYLPNAASGACTVTATAYATDNSTDIRVSLYEWSGAALTSPLDQTAGASTETNNSTMSTGTTGSLAQAAELVFVAAARKYNWTWQSDSSDPTPAPSGYTYGDGTVSATVLEYHNDYKVVSATTAVSASFTIDSQSDQGGTAVIATFKEATTNLRVEVTGVETAINGATGITAYVWTANPKDVKAKEYTNVSAQSSSGTVYLTPAPSGTANNDSVNVVLYQPGGTKGCVGVVAGTVKSYT